MVKAGDLLKKCKREIVSKFIGYENYSLKHSDFLKLSDEIYEASDVSISLSTLRRIFNDDFTGTPQVTTLNAFAKYLGFEDWNSYFKQNVENGKSVKLEESKKSSFNRRTALWLVAIVCIVSFIVFMSAKIIGNRTSNFDDVTFSYRSFDTSEMPITVFFQYKLNGITCDSATIQPLGWPTAPKGDEFSINPKDSIASYTYLWPETFQPKLTVNGKVVKKAPTIKLVTDGWKAAISNFFNTSFYVKYFDDDEIYKNGKLAFNDEILVRNKFSKDDIEQTVYNNFHDFNTINGNDFCFESRIKNNLLTRKTKSGNVLLDVFFENSRISLPLALELSSFDKMNFKAFGNYYSSENTDLSFLYLNVDEWTKLRIENRNHHFKLFLNDALVFSKATKVDPGIMTGIRYIFQGMGELDYVRFYNKNSSLVYSDEFD